MRLSFRRSDFMRHKKLLTLTSAALCATLLTACGGGGNSANFNANWYANTATPTVVEGTRETLTYTVTFDDESRYNTNYSAIYSKGTYIAKLTSETRNEKLLYCYETSLTIPVQYAYESETSEQFTDTVTSKVLFKNTQSGLQPVYAEKNVESHSPQASGSTKLENCYTYYHYSTVITYDEEKCGSGVCVYTDYTKDPVEPKQENFGIGDKYSYLDNDEILFAIRGMALTSTQVIQTNYVSALPLKVNVLPVKITPSDETSDQFSFKINGESVQKNIAYYPVTIALDVKNPGTTRTAWFAKTTDSAANINRNVMLRMEDPLYHQLGTLVYQLESAEFTKD